MLGHKTAISGALMVFARLISRMIDLITLLVLARLLVPADFGVVAIAMTVIYIIEAALELPLSQALVRLPVIESHYYDTAFTLGSIRGVLLCGLVCAASVPFAHFYHQPHLVALICVLSLAPASRGLFNPRMAQYAKDLNFKWEFLFELGGKLAAFTVSLVTALLFHSYWSIALGSVAAPLVAGTLSYIKAPFRPRFTLCDWRMFSDFLGWMTVSQLVMAFTWQSDQLLLGKLTRPAQLGMFSTANTLSQAPVQALFGPILRPLLSAFATVRDDHVRLSDSYAAAASAVVMLGLPVLVGENLVADPLVRLLLGHRWLGAIPMLRWLPLSLVPSLFAVPLSSLVMALGRTRLLVYRNVFELIVKLPLVTAGAIMFGFAGVIGARVISETLTVGYCIVLIRRNIGLSARAQLFSCARPATASAIMAMVIILCRPWLDWGRAPAGLAAQILATSLLGAVTYGLALWQLWRWAGSPAGAESRILGMAMRVAVQRPGRLNPAAPAP